MYCMSKKSWHILCRNLVYKVGLVPVWLKIHYFTKSTPPVWLGLIILILFRDYVHLILLWTEKEPPWIVLCIFRQSIMQIICIMQYYGYCSVRMQPSLNLIINREICLKISWFKHRKANRSAGTILKIICTLIQNNNFRISIMNNTFL